MSDGRYHGRITNEDFVAALEVLQGLGARRDVEIADGYP
jgi:hypothetical protein